MSVEVKHLSYNTKENYLTDLTTKGDELNNSIVVIKDTNEVIVKGIQIKPYDFLDNPISDASALPTSSGNTSTPLGTIAFTNDGLICKKVKVGGNVRGKPDWKIIGNINVKDRSSIELHSKTISIIRDNFYQEYRKIRTSKRLSREMGMSLENKWITFNGGHETLYRSCTTTKNNPTDENYGNVYRYTEEYKQKSIELQKGLSEATEAIQEHIYKQSSGITKVELDGQGLDVNKWYPITINLMGKERAYANCALEEVFECLVTIDRKLFGGGKSEDQSLWGHRVGYSFHLFWTCRAGCWGQRSTSTRRILSFNKWYLKIPSAKVVSMPKQINEGSIEYVYVRGGSKYIVKVRGELTPEIILHRETYTWNKDGEERYRQTLPILDDDSSIVEPITDLDDVKNTYETKLSQVNSLITSLTERVKVLENKP